MHRSEIGWSIEVEIPFRSINFDPNSDRWGINFQRTVRRKNEDSIWMGWARNQGLRRMTNAGLLTGISDVSQGLGLDVKPYALGTGESSPGRGKAGFSKSADAGVDVFYSPTPGLRSVLTVNTDFAQTEVDQRQVNLTRFSLFFPEKRADASSRSRRSAPSTHAATRMAIGRPRARRRARTSAWRRLGSWARRTSRAPVTACTPQIRQRAATIRSSSPPPCPTTSGICRWRRGRWATPSPRPLDL